VPAFGDIQPTAELSSYLAEEGFNSTAPSLASGTGSNSVRADQPVAK
jgi:hypothetical protein